MLAVLAEVEAVACAHDGKLTRSCRESRTCSRLTIAASGQLFTPREKAASK
jgi:hypothetical protein